MIFLSIYGTITIDNLARKTGIAVRSLKREINTLFS